MRRDSDLARNLCALVALYFGWCSIYALNSYLAGSKAVAVGFALVGLWFALVAAFDVLAISDDAAV